MAKKKAATVEKRSKGPGMAVAAGVCFALALFSLFVVFFSGSMPELNGVAAVLRGLGGHLRFFLPLVFAYLGVLFTGAARGKRVVIWRLLVNLLAVLCLYAAFHMLDVYKRQAVSSNAMTSQNTRSLRNASE